MNAQQRNKNRETAQTLKFSLMKWNSRNRRLELPVQPQTREAK